MSDRWMLFVDGESLVRRGREFLESRGVHLGGIGIVFQPNFYLWLPGLRPTELPEGAKHKFGLNSAAERSFYYASIGTSDVTLIDYKEFIWQRGFSPQVINNTGECEGPKAVGVALSTDVLTHAFANNFDAAVFIAGDASYVPLVEEIKRLGKRVYVQFFSEERFGLSRSLRAASDSFFGIDDELEGRWLREPDVTSGGNEPPGL